MSHGKHRYNELADFLKIRRSKILPSQVGLMPGARRRTPGLRREEVAQLAGIGLTWYTWLEQGREIQVSTQVIESLAKVLLLNEHERIHLYCLANQPLPTNITENQETVSSNLQGVLDSLGCCPSFIMDRHWNVIAWNQAADVLFGSFHKMNFRERNVVWAMFTNIKYRSLYSDWEYYAQGVLGRFRATCAQYIEDPWLVQFIEELKLQSEEFCRWWSLHEVYMNHDLYKKCCHPVVGEFRY